MSARAGVALSANMYRLPLFGAPERELRNGLKVGAAVGVLALAAAYLAPIRAPEITDVDEVPERFAKLILDEPAAPPAPTKTAVTLPAPPKVAVATPKPTMAVPKAPPRPAARRDAPPKVAEDRGEAGRERARQEVAQLEKVSESLGAMLADVSASLASNETQDTPKRTTRRRRARSGRSGAGVEAVAPMPATVNAGAGALAGALVQLADPGGLPATRATRGDGSAAASGEVRSDAELMAVVRKYAPGLQFCYDNELKKAPGLGGKLVVSMVVAASGRVTGVTIVRDTVGSAAMTACAVAQIEAWKFPTVPEGTVTFQAPFVFTPPR